MHPHELAVEVAQRVNDAVAPHLGTFEARVKVGDAPGGDATLAIDEVAETVVRETLEAEGDIGFYSEDQGLVRFGSPRAILVIDPVDGTRPAAAGLESCCVSVAVVPASEQATLGEVSFGVIHELKTGQRFLA
ncbi:MAG: inositol monophosphatase family protein [Acidimicrobiia bacterium]